MKRAFFTLGLLFLIQTLGISQEVYRSEYFASLPFWESPYFPFKGAVPITEEETKHKIHLQFDYDKQNRIIAVHVKLGKAYKAFEGSFGSLYFNASLTKVSYEGNKETHLFFDRFGNPTSVMGQAFKKVYTKDDYGRNIKLEFLDENGEATADLFGVYEYKWSHQLDGKIIEERVDQNGEILPLRGGFHFMRTRMTVGTSGYFETLENIDADGNLVNTETRAAVFKYYFDSQNRFDRWEIYDKDFNPALGPSNTAGEQYEVGKDFTNIIFFNEKGDPAEHWSGAQKWHMEKDKFGHTTVRSLQDENGKLKLGYAGYAQIKWKWSNDGLHLLSQSYYDADGNAILLPGLGAHKAVYERNRRGLVTKKIYQDAQGNMVTRTDNQVAYEVYKYGPSNKLLSIMYYDTKGNTVDLN